MSNSKPLRYVGDGACHIGVPARDLTAEEAARYAEIVAGSPLYEPVEEPAQAAEAAPVADGAGQGSKKRGKGE